MRHNRLFIIITMLFVAGLSIPGNAKHKNAFTKNPINDIVLIYQGNLSRPDWTIDEFIPYVTHTYADGSRSWLFQGFIFLEFATKEVAYINNIKNKRNATKGDWEWLMNRVFERNKALDALDKCIERQKAVLGTPPFRHKVILCLPSPLKGQTNWGKVGTYRLDFSKENDQLKAVEWYMNELIKRFRSSGYKNIDLEGFYWVEEDTEVITVSLLQQVSAMIHKKGLRFYWSPYYCARGCTGWAKAGFDFAYMQPNYVTSTNLNREKSYLTEALFKAKKANLAIEFDFDQKLITKPEIYIKRMNEGIEIYEKNKLFDDCALLYYDGGGTLLSIYEGKDRLYGAVRKSLYAPVLDRIARLIVKRQPGRATTQYSPYNPYENQSNTPSVQPAQDKSKKTYDWRDPEYWHF